MDSQEDEHLLHSPIAPIETLTLENMMLPIEGGE